jgi:predicted Zn-dependent protease with MMP-like domain
MIPDEETLQAWENMRIEILHELQEGAIADVPDAYLDEIGNLVVIIESWRAEARSPNPMSSSAFKRIGWAR